MMLGTNLRAARNRRGWTMAELAAASGLSKGFVSQVENDKTSPSLDTLEKLAAALAITIVDLLSEQPQEQARPLVRRSVLGDSRALNGYNRALAVPQVREAGRNSGDLKVYVAELPPGGILGDPAHRHGGDETVVVLAGRVEAAQGDTVVALAEGDALTWVSGTPHTLTNRETRHARLLVALSGEATLGLPLLQERSHAPRREPVPAGERAFRLVEMRRQRATGYEYQAPSTEYRQNK